MGMPLKFQFQFAGVDFHRPSSPHRKWLRIALMTVAALLACVTYWFYLHHLTHGAHPVVRVAPVAPPAIATPAKTTLTPATPTVPVTAAATVAATTSTASEVVKAAKPHIIAVGNVLVEAVENVATAAKARMTPTAAPVDTVPVIETVPVTATKVVSLKPVAPRPLRVRTEQDRLMMAGATAMANVIEQADKYPDSYGFEASDFLSNAKLGAAMPVYTIEESSRAAYQRGQAIKPLLKPVQQWVFPVLMGDRICCMVEVQKTGRDYVPGKGSKSLAMAWNKITEKWPAEAGFHPMLVMNPDVPGYYFTVPELSEQNITDVSEMFYLHPDTSPADVILASWR
jgi:hypothetical protein